MIFLAVALTSLAVLLTLIGLYITPPVAAKGAYCCAFLAWLMCAIVLSFTNPQSVPFAAGFAIFTLVAGIREHSK